MAQMVARSVLKDTTVSRVLRLLKSVRQVIVLLDPRGQQLATQALSVTRL